MSILSQSSRQLMNHGPNAGEKANHGTWTNVDPVRPVFDSMLSEQAAPRRDGGLAGKSEPSASNDTVTVSPQEGAGSSSADHPEILDNLQETSSPAIYVSPRLRYTTIDHPERFGADLLLNDVAYRRLDPDYFAWLRLKMQTVVRAYNEGQISQDAYLAMLTPFAVVQAQAEAEFDRATLDAAWSQMLVRASDYQPPTLERFIEAGAVARPQRKGSGDGEAAAETGFLWPEQGNFAFHVPVTEEALSKVRAIENVALSVGWTHEQLYQNRSVFKFPYGQEYGLVCFLKDNMKIGAVTDKAIEMKPADLRRQVMKFQRSGNET
ncbi:hypothetical protein SCOR_33065 [Sulfidibacter corallicola]|uniref:Uncharacterized protein n=1 Tax=Sulfidibacter corallicola TaxID=2818388 RepID=A0A8A4THV3_SULCO|nr:hypothetical protein [Sulfidibacter corallicola]QTD49629.1 hypothetical protein J3U87_28925 [Sulfidibacter corallicola]